MTLQNAASGNNLIARIPIVGTFTNTNNTAIYNSGQFNPGAGGGGNTAIWGNITGTLSNQTDLQTALNAKQATITTGSTSQYLRGDLSLSTFATDVRGSVLTGFDATVTLADITSSDSVLSAFNKTQRQLDDLDTRVLALNPSNSSFTNGGDNATANRTLGNNTNYALDIETNNITGLSIAAGGAVNVWDSSGNRYAVTSNYMTRGSLTVGDITKNFGGGTTGWQSNTASLLFECLDNTEIAVHDSGNRVASLFYYEGSSANNLTIGRDMGWGRLSNAYFTTNIKLYGSNATIPSSSFRESTDTPLTGLYGLYPTIALISHSSNSNAGSTIQIGEMDKRWNIGSAGTTYTKYLDFAYYEGTDRTPWNGTRDNTKTVLTLIASGKSNSNYTGASGALGINNIDPYYNLDIKGVSSNNGTFGFGINGYRTEYKDNLNGDTTIFDRQSGFFETNYNGSVTGLPSGYNNTQVFHLIDCRRGSTPGSALQIAGWANGDNKVWVRKTSQNTSWSEFLLKLPDGSANAWSTTGNAGIDASTHFIGNTNDADLLFKRNSDTRIRMYSDRTEFSHGGTERFRFKATNQLLVNTNSALNTPSTPHYAFNGNFGEDDGMYLIANCEVGFATDGTERLRVNSSRVKATVAYETSDGYYVGANKVIAAKSSTTISNVSGSATLTDLINSYNTLLGVLRDQHDLFN